MSAVVTDKIRKLGDKSPLPVPGPASARLYVDKDGQLTLNVDGTPVILGDVDAFDQSLNTDDTVEFATVTATGTISTAAEGRSIFVNPDSANRAVIDLFSNATSNELTLIVGDTTEVSLLMTGGAADHTLGIVVDDEGATISLDNEALVIAADSIALNSAVVMMASLPTEDPEVAGQLYSNNGVVTVSEGA